MPTFQDSSSDDSSSDLELSESNSAGPISRNPQSAPNSRFLLTQRTGGAKYNWAIIDPIVTDMLEAGIHYRDIAKKLGVPYATLKSRAGMHTPRVRERSAADEDLAYWVSHLPPSHPISLAIALLRATR